MVVCTYQFGSGEAGVGGLWVWGQLGLENPKQVPSAPPPALVVLCTTRTFAFGSACLCDPYKGSGTEIAQWLLVSFDGRKSPRGYKTHPGSPFETVLLCRWSPAPDTFFPPLFFPFAIILCAHTRDRTQLWLLGSKAKQVASIESENKQWLCLMFWNRAFLIWHLVTWHSLRRWVGLQVAVNLPVTVS